MLDTSEFREVYLEELSEQLETMEQEILALEQDGGSEAAIQRMFRAAHTLKGSSAAMGFEKMKELTHAMENYLDRIRKREASISAALVDLFFSCLDRMKRLQLEIVEYNLEKSDIIDLVEKLQGLLGDKESIHEHHDGSQNIHPQDGLPVLPHDLEEGLIRIRVGISEESLMKLARLSVIDTKISNLGTILWRDPAPQDQLEDEHIGDVQWLISTRLEQDEIKRIVGSLLDVSYVEIEPVVTDEQPAVPLEASAVHGQGSDNRDNLNSAVQDQGEKFRSNTIRVNVDRLEQLMNFVGELVIEQTRFQQVEKQFRQQYGSKDSIDELSDISDHLTRIVGELQDSVMKVRMLPIEQLFNRFPRMIRDLSHSLHKEVELILEGKETELDRTLIEEIGDPLIHLIRNAVDHGIETPEARIALGKTAKGTLRIQAAHEDNQVVITVADDGAGIDPVKIQQAAVSKGILTPEQAKQLTDREIIHLIFHPGFSTAAKLSDVSGRGVGMDIVRTDIERLNGLIDIETEIGHGTTFKIKLPLTLAIITGLLVKLAGRTFIFPMNNVTEIVRVEPSKLDQVRGIPVITIRDQIIPVIWLHDYLGFERTQGTSKFLPLVIIGRAEKRLAIAVDELLGNQEIVIKSLGSFIGKLEGIAGATILGDGKVALILEAGGIMKLVNEQDGTIH